MKRLITKTVQSTTFFLFIFSFLTNVNAQHNTSELPTSISASGNAPDASAMLDVQSTDKGILIPRVVNTSAISNPAEGLMIYDNSVDVFKYYDGSAWQDFGGSVEHISFTNTDNTFIGVNAGLSNTTGYYNTANGTSALRFNTTGLGNTAYGHSALYFNATGGTNTANGVNALHNNTSGSGNTANGVNALHNNTSGSGNTAYGRSALYNNTRGYSNVAVGIRALYKNTTHSNLVAVGDSALYNNGTGATLIYHATGNTAIGSKTLFSNTIGHHNTAIGQSALYRNTTGQNNTATGHDALDSNTTGDKNTAIGQSALGGSTTGNNNTATGYDALRYSNSNYNTAVGSNALSNHSISDYNTAVGYNALSSYDFPYHNTTAIGYNAQPTWYDQIHLGNNSITQIGGYASWSNVSDARFKTQIQSDVPGLAFISRLRPVTYQMDMDAIAKHHHTPDSLRLAESERAKAAIRYTGFLAQEVEQAAESIDYDFSGVDAPQHERDNYSLRYAEFVVPLVKAVQELEAENKALRAQNMDLEARLGKIEALLRQRAE